MQLFVQLLSSNLQCTSWI